ncbi:hypothetical protein [Microbispora sp. NPDC049633]|uniref:hypothetical protein n=1 Tax=Microbispora sp. NPDC049633 TaxID=3154355 RepID=UPI003441F92D
MSDFLATDPRQIARWLTTTDRGNLRTITDRLADRYDRGDLPRRSDVTGWLGTDPSRPTVGQTKPPLVGSRDHVTVASRLQFQGRMLHLPYYRGTAYNVPVVAGAWQQASLRAYDDPFQMASGKGLVLNQDGLWRFVVKIDHSPVPGAEAPATSRAARLEVNGQDVGLRDYLDDDADITKEVITTFTWTEQFKAGSSLNLSMRVESVPSGYKTFANIYFRAYLVRCAEGGFDHYAFPPPPPPPDVPKPPPGGPPVRGRVIETTRPETPVSPSYSNTVINTWYADGTPMVVHSGGTTYYSSGPGQPVNSMPENQWWGQPAVPIIRPGF